MIPPEDTYKQISKITTGEFKDKGSKFYAYIGPSSNTKEFDQFLAQVKAEHFKARHHCFAYRFLDQSFRTNDDGEPSGTAGKPIFNQLLSSDLSNTACIVVRYFGGTKLGTSGLINAYKTAAKNAIENAEIQLCYLVIHLEIFCNYGKMGALMNVLKEANYNIVNKQFEEESKITIEVPRSQFQDARIRILAKLLHRKMEDITDETMIEGLRFGSGKNSD